MIMDMLTYYSMIKKHNINIIYSGPIWADGIEGIAETLRKRLEFDALPLSASQSVFSVFVEQVNNMLMYSAKKEHSNNSNNKDLDVSNGVFVLGTKDKSYFIQTGNIIKNDNVQHVKERIDYLNTLDKKELRQYYKEQIRTENVNPENKSTELGLIEIARRTNSPIEYSFAPYGEGLSFFAMYVSIG